MDWQEIGAWLNDKVDQRLQGVLGTALAGLLFMLLCVAWRWLQGKDEPLNQEDADVLEKLNTPDDQWKVGECQITTPGLTVEFQKDGYNLTLVQMGDKDFLKDALSHGWLTKKGKADILAKALAIRDRIIKARGNKEKHEASQRMMQAGGDCGPIKPDPARPCTNTGKMKSV